MSANGVLEVYMEDPSLGFAAEPLVGLGIRRWKAGA